MSFDGLTTELVSNQLIVSRGQLPPMPPRARAILHQVAALHGLTPNTILSRSMLRRIVWARQHFMVRCFDECGYSSLRIGKWVSRDHSTVLCGIAAFRERACQGLLVAPENKKERSKAVITPEQRRELRAKLIAQASANRIEQYAKRRQRALFLKLQGVSNSIIAKRLGVTQRSVSAWLLAARRKAELG